MNEKLKKLIMDYEANREVWLKLERDREETVKKYPTFDLWDTEKLAQGFTLAIKRWVDEQKEIGNKNKLEREKVYVQFQPQLDEAKRKFEISRHDLQLELQTDEDSLSQIISVFKVQHEKETGEKL